MVCIELLSGEFPLFDKNFVKDFFSFVNTSDRGKTGISIGHKQEFGTKNTNLLCIGGKLNITLLIAADADKMEKTIKLLCRR